MARILKGTPVAAAVMAELLPRMAAMKEKGILPTLAIVRVDGNESSAAYERAAKKRCTAAGIRTVSVNMPGDCGEEELIAEIDKINRDAGIHGCLLLQPLPAHINGRRVCERLSAEKDVDGITSASLTGVFTGTELGFPPCTAQSCIELLDYYGCELCGKNAAVIGRSLIVGKPVSMLLQKRDVTVTTCHTKTRDISEICRNAEILIVAAGHKGLVDESFVNPEQVVIDVGINMDTEGRICGDVEFERVEPRVKAISPVPGGVGSVTTAVLCKHVVEAAERMAV